MSYNIFDFLKLLGSLGIFLFGMKLMSEALQKVAGDDMRRVLSAMTSNKFRGVLTGILITTMIQSSSATTVMVVSFVNAGLLDLVGSIGVIMGANVGTTVTAWLISILGFKVSMAQLALPIVGLSLPLLFSKHRIRKSWGELLIGFCLLFIGLEFLKNSMPDIKTNPEILTFLQNYSGLGYKSYFIFLFVGTVLTILIQSSSATMALTLVMCSNGWIQFDMAAAMVLGENIGTTVTANLAAMVANTAAKRTALAHLVFNLFGVIWVLSIFPLFLDIIKDISVSFGIGNPFTNVGSIPISLSLLHTIFNVTNVLVLIGFTKFIAKLVTRLIPSKPSDEESFSLKHIKIGLLSTPDASLFQAKQEINLYGKTSRKMFNKVISYWDLPSKEYKEKFEKINTMEDESDDIEIKIADYLTKVTETKLSTSNSQRIRAMLKIVSEIESVADSNLNIAKALVRRNEQKIKTPEELVVKLKHMFKLVDEALEVMCQNLALDYSEVHAKQAYEKEKAINTYRDILKQEHLIDIQAQKYDYPTGILYSDIFAECERIGDYVINVTEAMKEVKGE